MSKKIKLIGWTPHYDSFSQLPNEWTEEEVRDYEKEF